jgi:hypothetical protein
MALNVHAIGNMQQFANDFPIPVRASGFNEIAKVVNI